MASKVDAPFDKVRGGIPRLPLIPDGKSLVSPTSSARTPTYKDLASSWAQEFTKRIGLKITNQEEVTEEEVNILKQEVKAVFIQALQKDDRSSWKLLVETMEMLVPFSHLLSAQQDLTHYLERLHHHLDVHKERLFDLKIQDSVKKVFSKDLAKIEATGAKPAKVYCAPPPPKSCSGPIRKPPHKFTLPDGKDPFQLERTGEEAIPKPKGLTFGDLRRSIPNVALEMATREAIWSACKSQTALAMNIDLPDFPEENEDDLISSRSSIQLEEDYQEDAMAEDLSAISVEAEENLTAPMNGREAVEYFSKCYHTGDIQFMYFNLAPRRRYMPYDLIAVPKNKANPEHLVFSTFGVLHVYPKQPSVNMSLSDWQKEAVLFGATIKIPFFKNYLLKRMLHRWHANVHFKEFAAVRHKVELSLLQAVPSFGAAMQQIAKLCQELLCLNFLPHETDKCYKLGEFENAVNYMKIQAEKILERFFRYNKVIVDTTAEESFKKLHHCEEQFNHKTFFTKDSLHLQKAKKKQRELNLRLAKEETSHLGNFVRLVDQVLLSHLVQLARNSVSHFVHKSMALGSEASRDGMFRAFLVFAEDNALMMSPSKERFTSVLVQTFEEIPSVLCHMAMPMDAAIQHGTPDNLSEPELSARTPEQQAKTSSRHTSIASLMKDPKKMKPETLRRNQASVAAALGSQGSIADSSSIPLVESKIKKNNLQSQSGIVNSPDFRRQATPTKSVDSMGIATPDLVMVGQNRHNLTVSGHGFMGQYTPISKGNLEDKLSNDEAYKLAMSTHHTMMSEAIEEVEEYCNKNTWLNEIQDYCKNWNESSVEDWKGVAAFNIEQKLNELRQWGDRVRNSDRSYVTDNAIFYLDCSGIHDLLLPKLNQIFKELCVFVADESRELAKTFCEEMGTVLENIKKKETDIGGFAIYAKNVASYKKNTGVYQQRMEYIKSLFEVTRMSYRQLNSAEEKLEESVMTLWDAFLFHMQDAGEFVNTQTPLITQNLEDSFAELEEQARDLSEQATTGVFLDPEQKPATMLNQLRKIKERFNDVSNNMHQSSKWREAITGEAYELAFLQQMSQRMDIRLELWKYLDVTVNAILEWKQQSFKKLNAKKAMDKMVEWQAAAGQLKEHLPQGDDVLAFWFRTLIDFKKDLPVLHKLSNDALKPRHWKTIFLGMGEQHDFDGEMTVEDLLSYNLNANEDTINKVYSAAVAEYAIEQRLNKVRKVWNDREFKFAKHIPDSIYKKDETRARSAKSGRGPRKLHRIEKYRQEKTQGNDPQGLNIRHDSLYVLIDVDELKYLLQDSRVQVQTMLSSPFVADHHSEVSRWADMLAQLEEIVDLWFSCQKKWLYLLKVFDDVEVFMKMEILGKKFEAVHSKLMEIVQAAMSDSKVTSIVNHSRGEKVYRVHQGDRVRDCFLGLVETQEEVLKELADTLNIARSEFPRLYFLSNDELVELLAISRNPRALLPFARKCFYGIDSLSYDLSSTSSSGAVNTALDVELKSHKLAVTKIHGVLGETVPLYTPLVAQNSAPKWLATLEQNMKTTLQIVLESCLQTRLEDGSKQPIQLLEELSRYEQSTPRGKAEELTRGIQQTFSHWILRFPSQCVLTAEAVLWERCILRALDKQDKDEIRGARSSLLARVEQYIKVLKENSVMTSLPSNMRDRLHLLLGAMVNQALYHRDKIDKLLGNQNLNEGAFDWMCMIKYHMDIRTVLRAMTDSAHSLPVDAVRRQASLSLDSSMSEHIGSQREAMSEYSKQKTPDDIRLNRAMTTVSTGYQFGPCLVSQMGATFTYDHEYFGACPRLTMTPLTERAYISMTMSLRAFQCATLVGPPGTGKTETIGDLAKALGRHLVTVSCGEELTLPIMNQYLTGLVQSGCWALFDDTDRMTKGLMSVFAQQLEYVSNAIRVLQGSGESQYGIRGQPRFDKLPVEKSGEKRIRRNSLTTLHSLPMSDPPPLERHATVPHGFREDGLITYFEDTWVKERERRHSIEREIQIKESELYKAVKPPPLFYEQVTLHKKPRPDYKDLASQNFPYKPVYVGNILFNGELIKANTNFGCFMTINIANPACCNVPDNIKVCMRQCAMVVPDTQIIVETTLYCNGFEKYQVLSSKLTTFLKLLKTQLPRQEQYDFGLRSVMAIVNLARKKLHSLKAEALEAANPLTQLRRSRSNILSRSSSSTNIDIEPHAPAEDLTSAEEPCLILAAQLILAPKMASAEDLARFRTLLRDVFPQSSRPKSGHQNYSPQLVKAIEDQLKSDGMQNSQEYINKILALYSALTLKQGVILCGTSGSGKSSIYQTLCRAMNTLHNKDTEAVVDDNLHETKNLLSKNTQGLKFLRDIEPVQESPRMWKRIRSKASVANLWESLSKEEKFICPRIDLQVVFPNAMDNKQLFGAFEENHWSHGLFSVLLENTNFQTESAKSFMASFDEKRVKAPIETPEIINKWLVLDGAVSPSWVDNMSSMMDRERKLTLACGRKIALPESTSVIFELCDLTNASPSLISRCTMLHCEKNTVPWKFLIESWISTAKERWIINTSSIQVLNSLVSSTFQETLNFLANNGSTSTLYNVDRSSSTANQVAPGIQEVTNFLRFMTAMMDENFMREEWDQNKQSSAKKDESDTAEMSEAPHGSESDRKSGRQSSLTRIEDVVPNYMSIIKHMFAFAYIWGFGGNLHDSCMQRFSDFARETLRRAAQPIFLPDDELVYNFYVDTKQGTLNKWSDKSQEKSRNYSAHFAITPEVERYFSLCDLLLRNKQPVLLMGESGVGKSSMVQNLIQANHSYTRIMMSPVMTSHKFQDVVSSKILDLQLRASDPIYGGGTSGKKIRPMFYIEDLNTAHYDPKMGCQDSLELLREVLSKKSMYDPRRKMPISFENVDFLATSTNPSATGCGLGQACHVMSSRLTRLFVTLTFFLPDDNMLHGIYSKTLHSWLEEFPTYSVEHHMEFANALVQSSIDLYRRVQEKLKPSPVNAHYVFSLCDLGHLLEGMLLMSPRSKTMMRARAKKKAEKRHKKGEELIRSRSSSFHTDVGTLPPQMRAITRLWCHESTRVFGDRIVNEDDMRWFESALEDIVLKNLCTGSKDWQEQMAVIAERASEGESPAEVQESNGVPAESVQVSGSPSGEKTIPAEEHQGEEILSASRTEMRSDEEDEQIQTSEAQIDETDKMEGSSQLADDTIGLSREQSFMSAGSVTIRTEQPEITASPRSPNADRAAQQTSSPAEKPTSPSNGQPSTAKSSQGSALKSSLTESATSKSKSSKAGDAGRVDEGEDSETDDEASSSSSSSSSEEDSDSETVTTMTDPGGMSQLNQSTNLKRGKGGIGGKRGVTFKAGLIADKVTEPYTGPLMSMEQIKEPEERLTDFIFCKHILPTHAEAYGLQAERGYTEHTLDQLSEALYTCLALYNKASSQRIELVFFQEAIQHAARLSRVLANPSGHAVMLSMGYSTGRATLVRLAAYFAHCKLYEPKPQSERSSTQDVVKEHLKKCSRAAAIHNKQVLLLVHEELGNDAIMDICAFMKDGIYPGLYTAEEIQTIAQQMSPGQVKTSRLDKIEAAFSKFVARVRQNLHVIFCFRYSGSGTSSLNDGETLYDKLQKFPQLLTMCCHVDMYFPWTHEAYMSVAEFWLRDPNSKIAVPWNEYSKSEQIYLVSMAMAYIHQSAKTAVEKLFSHQRSQYKFFTPLTFTEFVHIFKVVASHINKEERTLIQKYEACLGKVNEAYESISSYKHEVSSLVPQQHRAQGEVKEHVECVEVQREQYKQALDTCKEEEQKIERMLTPLEALRAEAQIEFNKVNPTYHAALSALKSLKKQAIEEIKTYRIPPKMVNFVMDAVCLLFQEPQTWEAAKSLLIRDTFFHELEFFDKDNIPEDMYMQLAEFYHHPLFTKDMIRSISVAVSHLCSWVRAVYEYASICRAIQPKLQMLHDAEDRLNKAQATLGAKRVEANRIKSSLESRIQAYSDAIKKAKGIEKQIQGIERKIARSTHVMDNMTMQNSMWKLELKTAKSKIKTAPGDALITAAIICYHGILDNRTRADLMHDWLNRCEMANFDPTLRMGRQVKPVSLSAKMENFMRPQTYSITDSVHSIQQVEQYQAEVASHRDDASSIHEAERASSASSIPQMSLYKHHPSVYDTGISFKTEIRILDNMDPNVATQHDLDSIDTSSISSRNLLAVREGYTLQDVLSDFDELSRWKLKGLPTDVHSTHNALIMKVCCFNRKHCWPLLVDPDSQAEMWVRAIQDGESAVMSDPDNVFSTVADIPVPADYRSQYLGSESARTTESEFTEYSTGDDTGTIPDTESRGRTTRQSVLSMNTHTTGDEYRAVTSIHTSLESFRSQLQDHIDRPENNLWVVAADDPDVHIKILNSVIHGVTLLITHLERKPLDPLFRGLILKQFSTDSNGQRVVKIGDIDFPYHHDFALYLSSSVPLFLRGDGVTELPVEKMCTVDMSLSQELIIDTVLLEVLKTDQPEFTGHKRSMERDLIHHQQELNSTHASLMGKTLGLKTAILDEKTMLDALIECQRKVEMHKAALEEAQFMRETHEEKRSHLIPVATHGAKIYEIIQRMSVLNPFYQVPMSRFLNILEQTIQSRHRGKASKGDPKARAQELINALTSTVYSYVALMMYEPHLNLFSLLVTLERLRMAQQLTNQELGLFVNGFVSSELEDNIMFDDKPTWLSNKVWLDCAGLESTLPTFRGLKLSLNKHSKEWQEYFKCPVVLMSEIPGAEVSDLSIFQKCLLWRICCPNKINEVCSVLVLHELGGVVSAPRNYSVQEAYDNSSKATPVVCMLPSTMCESDSVKDSSAGHSFANPARQIEQFAREKGMEGKVHVVTCGIASQMSELHHVLQDCMDSGYWLIIQNAHLAEPWTKDMLELLKKIVTSRASQTHETRNLTPEPTFSIDSISESLGDEGCATVSTARTETPDSIHKDFRLWVTTRTEEGRLIPGLLVQNGLKISCEMTNNFKDSLLKIHRYAEMLFTRKEQANTTAKQLYGDIDPMIPLSLLYTLLVHHRNYGNGGFARDNYWSPVDLAAILDQFHVVVNLCQRSHGLQEICELVLCGHCIDQGDQKIVQAFINALVKSPKDLAQLTDHSPGVTSVLSQLFGLNEADSGSRTFEDRVDSLVDVDHNMMSLSKASQIELTEKHSRNLMADLVRVIGAPELISVPLELSTRKAESILQEVQTSLSHFPDLPKTNPDAFYPIELFLHHEIQMSREILSRLKTDVDYLLKVSRGEIASTPDSQRHLVAISRHQIPCEWQKNSFPTCTSLQKWVALLRKKSDLVTKYIQEMSEGQTQGQGGPVTFDLGAFHRPDRFTDAVLQNFVRREFKDLHACCIDVQFLPQGISPAAPPAAGVYISGLRILGAAWDPNRSSLAEIPEDAPTTTKMPVVWLKPIERAALKTNRESLRHYLYDCPIYATENTKCLSWDNIVGKIELPSVQQPELWTEKRVFLSCELDVFMP